MADSGLSLRQCGREAMCRTTMTGGVDVSVRRTRTLTWFIVEQLQNERPPGNNAWSTWKKVPEEDRQNKYKHTGGRMKRRELKTGGGMMGKTGSRETEQQKESRNAQLFMTHNVLFLAARPLANWWTQGNFTPPTCLTTNQMWQVIFSHH